jgi:hypothetical protein
MAQPTSRHHSRSRPRGTRQNDALVMKSDAVQCRFSGVGDEEGAFVEQDVAVGAQAEQIVWAIAWAARWFRSQCSAAIASSTFTLTPSLHGVPARHDVGHTPDPDGRV